ncbi:hypothetical protein L798_10492 [Zootermopsis nevadensis]|uniref:Uncharacterized protein n=1 Tax=Zootermopsis nevadensis TaxID=136037 RepID=A0A067RT91_ZOONE|nr:hypothetical protein L798_10492 [Zootermopsis nevadensis]
MTLANRRRASRSHSSRHRHNILNTAKANFWKPYDEDGKQTLSVAITLAATPIKEFEILRRRASVDNETRRRQSDAYRPNAHTLFCKISKPRYRRRHDAQKWTPITSIPERAKHTCAHDSN